MRPCSEIELESSRIAAVKTVEPERAVKTVEPERSEGNLTTFRGRMEFVGSWQVRSILR